MFRSTLTFEPYFFVGCKVGRARASEVYRLRPNLLLTLTCFSGLSSAPRRPSRNGCSRNTRVLSSACRAYARRTSSWYVIAGASSDLYAPYLTPQRSLFSPTTSRATGQLSLSLRFTIRRTSSLSGGSFYRSRRRTPQSCRQLMRTPRLSRRPAAEAGHWTSSSRAAPRPALAGQLVGPAQTGASSTPKHASTTSASMMSTTTSASPST